MRAVCLTAALLAGCASGPPDVVSSDPVVIEVPREVKVCPAAPAFAPRHGMTSEQLDEAHQAHILELRRIIDCWARMADQ